MARYYGAHWEKINESIEDSEYDERYLYLIMVVADESNAETLKGVADLLGQPLSAIVNYAYIRYFNEDEDEDEDEDREREIITKIPQEELV